MRLNEIEKIDAVVFLFHKLDLIFTVFDIRLPRKPKLTSECVVDTSNCHFFTIIANVVYRSSCLTSQCYRF